MTIQVVPYREQWPTQFAEVEAALARALAGVPVVGIEHVGSTSVPGLAAKPILDIDIIVERADVGAAIAALAAAGYQHRGDLGVTDRDSLLAPDADPKRNGYVCVAGTLHLRNHLAVREVLRRRPDLRDRYAAVKLALASDPGMDIDTYLDGKSDVLLEVLGHSDLSEQEKALIFALNTNR